MSALLTETFETLNNRIPQVRKKLECFNDEVKKPFLRLQFLQICRI